MERLHNARTDLSCKDCIHRMVCNNKEEYAIFLDETMKEPFDLMPDFLDMHVSCKYFCKDYPILRNTSSYILKKRKSENIGGNHA